MIPYIRSVGKDTISCDCDLAILDGNTPILLSLVDYGIKTRKVTADIITNDYKLKLSIEDREDITFKKELSTHCYSESGYNFKSDRQGELTHTIIKNKKINDGYLIDWDNIGLRDLLVNHLRNVMFMPVTKTMIEAMLVKNVAVFDKYSMINKLDIHTNNPMFENLSAYKINATWIKQELSKPQTEMFPDGFNWDYIETFEDYIYSFIDPIKAKISETVKPLYNPKVVDKEIFNGVKKPYNGQIPLIQSAIEVLKRDRFVYIGAEMGVGGLK
jgi:hypothetical protein